MMDIFIEMISYPFMVRAIIVGCLVSLCASLLGTSLVLKRYSMIGDGLSHVGFAALAIAYAFHAEPLTISIPACIAAAFFLLQLKDSAKIKGDSATALLCSGALAIGVMTISLSTGMNTDVCNYMFGSILAMSADDVRLSVILGISVVLLFILFYNRIFAVTFDEPFASATGTRTRLYNMIIAFLTAITTISRASWILFSAVLGFRSTPVKASRLREEEMPMHQEEAAACLWVIFLMHTSSRIM